MLKKAASGVLSSQESSTYPGGYASPVLASPAALLDGLFEHLAGERIAQVRSKAELWEQERVHLSPSTGRQASGELRV
jgi:hypothetical protein